MHRWSHTQKKTHTHSVSAAQINAVNLLKSGKKAKQNWFGCETGSRLRAVAFRNGVRIKQCRNLPNLNGIINLRANLGTM